MKSILLLLISFVFNATSAQVFTIHRLEVADNKINIYYDLVDTIASRSYTIALLSSVDNFISPLQKVKGDLGLEVKPGYNRKIVWNAKDELGAEFNGQVNLEVRGRLYIPFIRLDGLNRIFKRLTPTEITWTGGTEQNILNLDLYNGDEKITSFPNLANIGHYKVTIPYSVKPGKDYRLRITDSRNKDQVIFSQPLRVVRKFPLLFKMVPIVIIGLGSFIALSGNKAPRNIPDPITPQ
jgi:hypothetical protein